MKLSPEECVEVVQSTGQHMSPPALARTKSSMGSIVVDMGNRGEVEVRGMDMYSPCKKSARPEPASRIHLIPLLMIFVFFVLWAGSTEVPLNEDLKPEVFAMKLPTTNGLATSGQVVADEISQRGTETALDQDHPTHHQVDSHALSTNGLSEKTYVRGTTR